ncbi:MAG: glutamate-cysteine ligase family protein [Gemmatimonadota bacterium]
MNLTESELRAELPLSDLKPFVRSASSGESGSDEPGAKPEFDLPGGGRITFEPGGQLEYSGPPAPSSRAAGEDLHEILGPLRRRAALAGIDLLDRGILDPAEAGPVDLQVPGIRYRAMEDHFDRIGPWGRIMMCRTASMQINLDLGPPDVTAERWRLAELLVPVLGGAFANSPMILPDGSRASSARLWLWRRVDPWRTGFVHVRRDESLADAYLRFGLQAPVILRRDETGIAAGDGRTFAEWLHAADEDSPPALSDWTVHLSTLFPHVRPRRWIELRFLDTPREAWWDVPLLVAPALLYDDEACREAIRVLAPLADRLEEATAIAAHDGLSDPMIGRMAESVFRLALDAAGRMPGYFGAAQVSMAEAFCSRFTSRRRTQADEDERAGG